MPRLKRQLKANPAFANLPVSLGKSPLPSITRPPLSMAVFNEDVSMVMLLLQAGAKVNGEDDFGRTVLEDASFLGNKTIVALLFAHRADVTLADSTGETALHLAVRGDHPDMIAVLLAHGVDVNARDKDGETALMLALSLSQAGQDRAAVIKLLRRHGAKK